MSLFHTVNSRVHMPMDTCSVSMGRDTTYPLWHTGSVLWGLGRIHNEAYSRSWWFHHVSCPMMRVQLLVPLPPHWTHLLTPCNQYVVGWDWGGLGFSASPNLWWMESLMHLCLHKNSRNRVIKEQNRYWVATLLHPRYKGKLDRYTG